MIYQLNSMKTIDPAPEGWSMGSHVGIQLVDGVPMNRDEVLNNRDIGILAYLSVTPANEPVFLDIEMPPATPWTNSTTTQASINQWCDDMIWAIGEIRSRRVGLPVFVYFPLLQPWNAWYWAHGADHPDLPGYHAAWLAMWTDIFTQVGPHIDYLCPELYWFVNELNPYDRRSAWPHLLDFCGSFGIPMVPYVSPRYFDSVSASPDWLFPSMSTEDIVYTCKIVAATGCVGLIWWHPDFNHVTATDRTRVLEGSAAFVARHNAATIRTMTKKNLISSNAIFLFGGYNEPPVSKLADSLIKTGVKLVMLENDLWRYPGYGDVLIDRLIKAGITIWYHIVPPNCYPYNPDIRAGDFEWLEETCVLLMQQPVRPRAIFCDGNEFFGGNLPWSGGPWDNAKFRWYRDAARAVIGPTGMLTGSCWMWEPERTETQGMWECHERDTPRGMVENFIANSTELKKKYPNYRCEIGWIGQDYNYSPPIEYKYPWSFEDYAYVWRRAQEAKLPITYRTNWARMIAEADTIATCEAMTNALK